MKRGIMPIRMLRPMRLFTISFFVLLIVFSGRVAIEAQECWRRITELLFPSLFPFLLYGAILSELSAGATSGKSTNRLMRFLFGLPGEAAIPLFCGLFCGFPVGVISTRRAMEAGALSKEEAAQLSRFVNNPSPAFCISFVGTRILSDARTGFLIWLCVIGVSLLYGAILGAKKKPPPAETKLLAPKHPQEVLLTAVRSSLRSFGILCAFFLGVRILLLFGSAFLNHFHLAGKVSCAFLGGISEVAGGMLSLNAFSTHLRAPLAAFFLGFNGIAVFLQSLEAIRGLPLRKTSYLLGKVCCGLISGVFLFSVEKIVLIL